MQKLRLAVTTITLSTAFYLSCLLIQSDAPNLRVHGEASPVTQLQQAESQFPEEQEEVEFDVQVNSWIHSLSTQNGFESWRSAHWDRYALGPGTHGWIVLLQSSDHEELGYLVVHATPDGRWSLTEYGTGPSPLFSMTTLYRSMIQQELIPNTYTFEQFITNSTLQSDVQRLYYSPLHAVWQVTTHKNGQPVMVFTDAKTGEQLPLGKDSFMKWAGYGSELTNTTRYSEPFTLVQEVKLPSFDPFHNTYWINGIPLEISDFEQLQNAIQQEDSIAYVAKLFNKRILAPFAVIGYAEWSGSDQPFIRLEQEGSRFIPLYELFENGFFFP